MDRKDDMAKVIFELTDYKETPNSPQRLNIEIRYEPLKIKGESLSRELSDVILESIDKWRSTSNGVVGKIDAGRY